MSDLIPDPTPVPEDVDATVSSSVGEAAPEASQSPAVPEPVGTPIPAYPVPQTPHTHGGIVATCVAIAVAGVLLSALAGGLAGLATSEIAGGTSSGGGTTASIVASAGQEPVAAAAAVALPSVVNIDVTGSSNNSGLPTGHPDVPTGGTGSGVAFRATNDGGTYILTNNHVVDGASKIVVTSANGERLDGKLVGTDPQTDMAVVKISKRLPLITVADSEKLTVGQLVVAIGSPFGLQDSVSSGVISALHRSLTSSYSNSATGTAYPLVDVIQTDAAINPGNSGGALLDRQGSLIGIDSAIYTESGSSAGVGFAIPSNAAARIASELISSGKARHPFLGVEGRTVTEAVAKSAGLAKAEGASVERVIAGTGAAKAGLRKGDIVTALNGQPIRTMDDLILAVRRAQVGDVVTLTVWRDRAQTTIKMTVGDKPANLS